MKNTLALLMLFAIGSSYAQTLSDAVARGKTVYDANCSTCHGANGMGGNGPPALNGNKLVLYDTAAQIRILLDGQLNRGMPSWAKLTSYEIADVMTFTKNQWGNQTGVIVSPVLVDRMRSRGDSCVDQLMSPLPRPAGTNRIHTVETPTGKVAAWWCQLPARQGDQTDKAYWRAQVYPVHKDDVSVTTLVAAAGRIAIASDSVAQAWTEVNAARVALEPGSRKEYDYKLLVWQGCEKLRVTPLPNGVAFDTPLPADYCGPVPIPPPVVNPLWVTSGLSSYNSANGVLGSYAGSIRRGVACNDSIPAIRVGSSTYKNFAGATKPTLVAQCTLSVP